MTHLNSSILTHLAPNIESKACLRLVDGDHMGLQDAVPGVLLPPIVVVMVLRVHHHSHSVGGADNVESENITKTM